MGNQFGLANASINNSEQEINQTNENIQENLQAVKNSSKTINMQDYTTYIRTSTINKDKMVKSLKASCNGLAELLAKNVAEINCGVSVDGDMIINQVQNFDQTIENGVQALQKSAEKLKRDAQTVSEQTINADQDGSNKQKSNAENQQESEQGGEAEQEADQESFLISRFNPMKVIEGFNGLRKIMKKESFVKESFQAGLINISANNSKQSTNQRNTNRSISQQVLDNNSEIANKISTAYDKITNIVNEFEKEEKKIAEANAEAKITSENIVKMGMTPEVQLAYANKGLDPSKALCVTVKGNMEITQGVTVKQSLILKGVIDQITDTDLDAETAVIMADMLGLSQSATTDQDAGAEDLQSNKQTLKASQIVSQIANSGLGLGIIIIIILVALGIWLYNKYFKNGALTHPYFNNGESDDSTIYTNPDGSSYYFDSYDSPHFINGGRRKYY